VFCANIATMASALRDRDDLNGRESGVQ